MKKILTCLLSLAMVFCMMPAAAFAQTSTPKDLTGAEITLKANDFIYDGTEKKAEIDTVKLSGEDSAVPVKTLTDAGCKIEYRNNINAGTATVTLTAPEGNTSYTGSAAKSYTIEKRNLSDEGIVQEHMSVLIGETVKISDIVLIDRNIDNYRFTEKDITLEGTVTIKAGTNSVTVKAVENSNYMGSRTVTVYGGKAIPSEKDITFSTETFTYNGKAQQFRSIRIVDPEKSPAYTLKEGYDYTVSYRNNVNASDLAEVKIEGKGDYAGTFTKTFSIEPKSISGVYIEAIENQIAGEKPVPTIKDTAISGAPLLIEGKDYTLSYNNYNKVGTAEVVAHGTGNYKGEAIKSYQVKKRLAASVTPYPDMQYTYTGSPITPILTVTPLNPTDRYVQGRDYKILGAGKTDAGTYKFSVVGTGDYGGTIYEGTYTIVPAVISFSSAKISLSETSWLYTGKPITPVPVVTCGGRTLRKDIDYTVFYVGNTQIGTAAVYVSGKGNYTGSVSASFRIIGKDISSVSGTLSQSSYKYDGLEKKPAVTLYDGTKKLTAGTDYTVSYRNNRNAGTGEVIVTGKGNYGGTKTLTFRIIGKEQTVTSRYSRYYRTPESDSFNLNAEHDGDGYLVYSSSDTDVAEISATGRVTVKGTGRAVITVSTAGTVRYEPASKRITIDVRPVTPAVKAVSAAKGKVKVTITKVEGATKYQVKYGRSGKYRNRYITHRDNEYAKVISTIRNLPSGTHYIKVRAYKTLDDGTKIWGKWVTKKVRVK